MVIKSFLEKDNEKNLAVGLLLLELLAINQHKENKSIRPLLPEFLIIIDTKITKLQEQATKVVVKKVKVVNKKM